MTTVSVCMIVKNEESMLPNCLNSVIGWADEIIVVDTGSEDKTVEIAKSYGARVMLSPWRNDFSFHRNESIAMANGCWICVLDADECIVSDMSRFKDRLAQIPESISALVCNISEITEGQPTSAWLGMRFFRKSSGIHYRHAVHNKAIFTGGTAGTDIQMHHFGYSLDREKMDKKRKRTETLLLERLTEDENDHAALYYMTQMRIGQKRYQDAIDYGLSFFKTVPIHPADFQFYGVMYFYMAWAYLHIEDGENALAWAKKGLEFYPDDIDLNYMMARIGYQAKMDDLLIVHGKKYLEALPQARDKGLKSDSFQNEVSPNAWRNRTVYTADNWSEQAIRGFLEGVAA